MCVKTEFVDGERIKEDVWYKLVNGEFVEQYIDYGRDMVSYGKRDVDSKE